jgi:hypothetical protein
MGIFTYLVVRNFKDLKILSGAWSFNRLLCDRLHVRKPVAKGDSLAKIMLGAMQGGSLVPGLIGQVSAWLASKNGANARSFRSTLSAFTPAKRF